MRYGSDFEIVEIPRDILDKIEEIIESKDIKFNYDRIDRYKTEPKDNVYWRKSQINWLDNSFILKYFSNLASDINSKANWNLNISGGSERVQYTQYGIGDFYDWHEDEGKPRSLSPNLDVLSIRKISMTMFLNNDFDGGEFDIEIYSSMLGRECRYETIPSKKGTAVFFKSDYFHRVRSVTKGLRKSLVIWWHGLPYDTLTN
tara:strand:- start:33 stop:638 length:606 start_codon:yes stop_codon:yes gene_type:complete